jgi:hypothetical protein
MVLLWQENPKSEYASHARRQGEGSETMNPTFWQIIEWIDSTKDLMKKAFETKDPRKTFDVDIVTKHRGET